MRRREGEKHDGAETAVQENLALLERYAADDLVAAERAQLTALQTKLAQAQAPLARIFHESC